VTGCQPLPRGRRCEKRSVASARRRGEEEGVCSSDHVVIKPKESFDEWGLPDDVVVEQDHRAIKRRVRESQGSKPFTQRGKRFRETETVNMTRNRQIRPGGGQGGTRHRGPSFEQKVDSTAESATHRLAI
jgi:hypothetical protein